MQLEQVEALEPLAAQDSCVAQVAEVEQRILAQQRAEMVEMEDSLAAVGAVEGLLPAALAALVELVEEVA